VKLTTYLSLVPRLRMSGTSARFYPPPPAMPLWRGQGKLTLFFKFGCGEVGKDVGGVHCEAFRSVDADARI
jgi:hypothetical protein